MRILALSIAVAALVPLMSMPHASAQPVAGATYTGTHSGGGAVEFPVSGDGSQVLGFTAYDVPGDACEFQGPWFLPIALDIVDDSFGPGIPGLYEVSGSFPSEGNAEGTLRLVVEDPACDSGVVDWTATASFPTPTPSPSPAVGGIAELPEVSDSSAPNYLALAGLAAAALVALIASGWYTRGRRLR
ncbi:MAG: hypothetical protein JSU97_02320 [Dehalococcoidia bacterium]|nr:MAG: hypothetical protein JSU97_02320 [Dehalococcoidia bacterium]